ncbi:uncharacterized protein LOC103022681 isoform X1 [Astyanax mexicanus]|uniref:uncharacterized protein LOC103022681 isoform X1 n=1 Tax=Astyanax mexicanus TaxID=7994 RepID=UPI0020CB1719|nr:uncharacterized protein LOC103022681 isoform X1 [Astyanax mexicanus]
MESLGDKGQNEAHCQWALCSHPCCWEAEQGIAKGIYSGTVKKPTEQCTAVHESFPSLTVVNASEWTGLRRHSEEKLFYKTVSPDSSVSEGSLHSITCTPVLPQKVSTQRFKSAESAFSSVYPAAQPTAAKGVKLNKAHISPDLNGSDSPLGTSSLVLWVPNPHYTPQCLKKRSNLPQCAVKELICLPACPVQNASEEKKKLKSVKKMVSFQQACSPLNKARLTFSCQPDSASNQSRSGEGQRFDNRGANTGPSSATLENRVNPKEGKKSPLILRNRPVLLHAKRERGGKRVSMDALKSPYKLDSETGGESIEWDRLRRQACLWKRHNSLQHKDCSVSGDPPGGASVLLVDSGLCPVSSVRSHHNLQSPLSVAPAAWHCTKGIWHYQKSSQPPLSHSKYLHSTASEAEALSTDCSSSTVADHRASIQMPGTDEKSVKEKGIKGIITLTNSLLHCQQSNQEHPDNMSKRSVVKVDDNFPEKLNHSSKSSLTLVTGAEEPWSESSSTEKGPEPKAYQVCTPPPSLSSL